MSSIQEITKRENHCQEINKCICMRLKKCQLSHADLYFIWIKVAPYSFLSARVLVLKSRDGVNFKKSAQKSCAIKRNELSTNMASKIVKKLFETVARVSFSFKTFIEWTQDAACLYLIQKRKERSLLELQLICSVVTRITRMGQNKAVCYLTYLQSSMLFVEEIQKGILSPNMCPNVSKNSF